MFFHALAGLLHGVTVKCMLVAWVALYECMQRIENGAMDEHNACTGHNIYQEHRITIPQTRIDVVLSVLSFF